MEKVPSNEVLSIDQQRATTLIDLLGKKKFNNSAGSEYVYGLFTSVNVAIENHNNF